MLGPSLSLGRLAGIPLRIHWSFSLLLVWVILMTSALGGDVSAILFGVVFFLSIFGCVVLHELGHCLAARRYGIETRHITLSPLGGVAALTSSPARWSAEFWIAVAGPAVNLVICLLLIPVLLATGATGRDFLQPLTTPESFLPRLFLANVVLMAFNLIPAFPLDGGRVFRALLESGTSRLTATRIAARTGQAFAVLLGLGALFVSPFLLFISIFIFFAAEMELRGVKLQSGLRDIRVGDVMRTSFHAVYDRISLGDLAEVASRTGQESYPLVRGSRVIGIVDRSLLHRSLHRYAPEVPAREVAIADFAVASPGDDLATAAELMGRTGQMALPVFEAGRLVGMLDQSAVSEVPRIVRRTSLPAREAPRAPLDREFPFLR